MPVSNQTPRRLQDSDVTAVSVLRVQLTTSIGKVYRHAVDYPVMAQAYRLRVRFLVGCFALGLQLLGSEERDAGLGKVLSRH
jgi:hypothetical protein